MKHDVRDAYELTIGIECHVQLATATKLFSPADNDARDKEPNMTVHPIDYGLPGMLPILNREAVYLAVRAAKALNASVASVSRFDRKHYFYPDLPKGYQTTQMYHPIVGEGYVDAPLESGEMVRVRIHHAHMEEDAGKLTHYSDHSLVDLNRAGTPLIEIVSEPDIHSPEAAKAFATELYRLMTYAGVTHGDLYHGNMRFDVNVSVAPKGSDTLGRRAEVKNLNSFRSVEKAAEYEFSRQIEMLEKGETVVQETRGWDDTKFATFSQRSKEDAQDYRYMPDADIPPIVLSDEEIMKIQSEVPMLPAEYRARWSLMNMDNSVINKLLDTPVFARKVTDIQDSAGDKIARYVANWLASSVQQLTEGKMVPVVGLSELKVANEDLIELAKMTQSDELSSTAAKQVFFDIVALASRGEVSDPRTVAESKNLLQDSDEASISVIVDEVLNDPMSASSIADLQLGREKAIGYLVGQIMKKSQGKANPALAQKIIKKKLSI